jgi:hypothetical protein
LNDTADSVSQNPEELKSERRYKFWNYYYYYYYYYYYCHLMPLTATVGVATCGTATGLQSEARIPAETVEFSLSQTPAFALWPTQLAAKWIP